MFLSLCGHIARFFSRGPYRFLALLLLGSLIFGWGWIYDLVTQGKRAPVPDLLMVVSFFLYFSAACWYGYLIKCGKWKDFWEFLLAIIGHWQAVREQFVNQQREKKRLKGSRIVKKAGIFKLL